MTDAIHPMRIVAERTGMSPHVIRAWERRHGAVVPRRTVGNRRLYTQADIERLLLLRHAVEGGYSIAQLAKLSVEELHAIGLGPGVRESLPLRVEVKSPARSRQEPLYPEEYARLSLEAINELDAVRLERILDRAALDEGRRVLVNNVIRALLEEIGDRWKRGEIRAYHEHLAAAVIRKTLADLISRDPAAESRLVLVLSTPTGTLHELGCLMAATVALAANWRSVYLGTSLPAQEIAAAAVQAGATAVGLSVVYPAGEAEILSELTALRRQLPSEIAMLIGGRAGRSYAQLEGNVSFVESLEELEGELELLSASDLQPPA